MALLATAAASRAGVELVLVAVPCAVGGDTYANTGREVLVLSNLGAVPAIVSVAVQWPVDGRSVAAHQVSIPAGTILAIGPFGPGLYSDPATGLVHLTYSSVADLYARVLQV